MDSINDSYKKRKIEEIKRKTKPVDAMPLIKFITENSGSMTDDEKKTFMDVVEKSFDSVGKMLIDRALTEGVMTEKEYVEISEKYNLSCGDFGVFLQGYFNRKDGIINEKDKIVVVAVKSSSLYKCREFIFKRFAVVVLSCEECIEMIDKEKELSR